jgi:CheY-like chemotaxis protein
MVNKWTDYYPKYTRAYQDLVAISVCAILLFVYADFFDFFEMLSTLVSKVETRFARVEDLVIVCIFLPFALTVFSIRRRQEFSVEMTTRLKRAITQLEHQLAQHVLTEKALSETKELFQSAFDYAPAGIVLTSVSNVELDDNFQRLYPDVLPGKYVLITVSDNGIGMDQETKARLFEPFFTTKEVGRGTGLGLSMVYGIVKQSDGHLNVYSELGHGTTFKIYLPIVESATEKVALASQAPMVGGTETILVVEDDDALRYLARDVLNDLGYTVMLARDGKEALEIYAKKREQIDLMLLDVMMPRMGGTETYERIRQLGDDVPSIFMTGYSSEIVRSRFVDQEMLLEDLDAIIIQKPYSGETLGRKIREVLDVSRARALTSG